MKFAMQAVATVATLGAACVLAAVVVVLLMFIGAPDALEEESDA